jgi:hypothetical protein
LIRQVCKEAIDQKIEKRKEEEEGEGRTVVEV